MRATLESPPSMFPTRQLLHDTERLPGFAVSRVGSRTNWEEDLRCLSFTVPAEMRLIDQARNRSGQVPDYFVCNVGAFVFAF